MLLVNNNIKDEELGRLIEGAGSLLELKSFVCSGNDFGIKSVSALPSIF
jgi:hypothetical protein